MRQFVRSILTGRLLLLVLVILSFVPAAAQVSETGSWRVIAADAAGLYTITADGVSETLGQAVSYPPLQQADYTTTVINGDFFAVRAGDSIILGDLSAPECCTSIPDPALAFTAELAERGQSFSETTLLGITPDGQNLLIGVVLDQGRPAHGAVMLFPTDPSSNVRLDLFTADREDSQIKSVGWVGNQFHMVVGCYLCTHSRLVFAHLIYEYGSPNDAGQLTVLPLAYRTGAYLYATGELLEFRHDDAYPPSNQVESPVTMPNVLTYRADADSAHVVLYHDTDNLSHYSPHWVMDGQAYLFEADKLWLAYRDGRMEATKYPNAASIFLSGTPDGWLVLDTDSGAVFHYTSTRDVVVLGTLPARTAFKVVSAPALGMGETLAPPQALVR